MYNVETMINDGRQAIRRNPQRDATAQELRVIRDGGKGDEWETINRAYLFGVALGVRIAEAERRRPHE